MTFSQICDLLPDPRPRRTGTQLFSHQKTCVGSSSCCSTVPSLCYVPQDHCHCFHESILVHVDTTGNRRKHQWMDSHPPGVWLRFHFNEVQKVTDLCKTYFRTSGWVRWCCAWRVAYQRRYVFDHIFGSLVKRYNYLSSDFEVPHLYFSWSASPYMPSGQ